MQVLSQSVANGFENHKIPGTRETARFVRIFDKVFDCLNVRSVSEWKKTRKPENLTENRMIAPMMKD